MKQHRIRSRLLSMLTALTMLTACFIAIPITASAADMTTISTAEELKAFCDDVNGGNSYEGKTVTLTADIDLDGGSKNQWESIGSSGNQFKGTFDGGNHKISGLYIRPNITDQGLFSYVGEGGTVKNLGVGGVVDGREHVGGVVGTNCGTVTNCYSTAAVSGSYDVGGVVGRNCGTVTNCHNTGSVAGSTEAVGGIVGYNATDAIIAKCYNTGNVKADEYLGGIAGYNYGIVENCYNTGKVTVSKEIGGGIVGYNYTNKTVTNCYNTGIVKTDLRTGGIVGENRHGTGEYLGIVTNCYYLDTSAASDDNGAEITAQQLASQNTFSGWDFGSVWTMSSEHGRPILADHREPNPIVMEGDGTAGNPYKIGSLTILEDFRRNVNNGEAYTGKFFELTTDIDLDGSDSNPWVAIGTDSKKFKGNFDGCNHKITGLYIKNSKDYQGLFGYVGEEGSIKNLRIEGKVSGDNYTGGVAGYIGGTVENCYNECTVSGGDYVGGVSGYVKSAVTSCHNSANVKGNNYVGGVIGYSYDDVTNSDNSGEVNGSSHVGGVIGYTGHFSSSVIIENCYNTGLVYSSTSTGGVVGDNSNTVRNCYNTGVVDGSINAGGVVGRCRLDGSIENCYNTGTVKGEAYIGGVVGLSVGSIEGCYYLKGAAAGGINGADYEGETEAKTLEQFALGEVAYLLQHGQSEQTWGQTLSGAAEASPILTSDSAKNVYKVTFKNGTEEYAVKYGNPSGVVALPQEPTKFNYTFKQWSADETGGSAFTTATPLAADITVYAQFTKNKLFQNGDGTKENPFEISNLAELEAFRDDVNSGESYRGQYIRLTADINLGCSEENPWTTIGRTNKFYGTFDGGNHKITGLYTNSKNNYQGLFGTLGKDGTIKNLSVEGTVLGDDHVGGVVGDSDGIVENCNYKGTVKGRAFVGGVVGYSDEKVIYCYNTGAVSGDSYVGGITGLSYGAVTNCYNTGSVTATKTNSQEIGGVVGGNRRGATVTNCYNTGTVAGNSSSGGVVGNNEGTAANCYYLEGAATGGINGGDVSGQAEAKTSEQLASGEVAYLLQKGQTEQVWGQTLSGVKDINPILTSDSSKNVYKVTFMTSGTEEHAVRYGNPAGVDALPDAPAKIGYTFTKWSTAETGGEEFTANTVITGDKTVYAQFHKHTLVHHAANDATCTEAGTGEYWQCSGCNMLFSDAEGTTEINKIPAGENAKGHNYGKWELTLTDNATEIIRTCQNDASHQEKRNAEIKLVIDTDNPYVYSGEEYKPKASVKVFNGIEETVLTEDTDYTLAYENNINAGTATVKITGTGDYSGTVERTFTIGAKTLTATAATTQDKTYDGTKTVDVTSVTLDGVVGEDTVAVNIENLMGTLASADAGDYTEVTLSNLTLVNNENNNYILHQPNITLPTEVTIEKADIPSVTAGKPLNIANNLEKEYTYLPARLCPRINEDGAAVRKAWGALSYEIESIDFTQNGYYDANTAHIDQVSIPELSGVNVNIFYLPINYLNSTETGKVGTVTIKIKSKNYNDFTNTFDIIVHNKNNVTFGGITIQNSVYNGEPWSGYTGDLTVTDSDGTPLELTPEILYAGISSTSYSECTDPPTNAGTYSVIFSVDDTDENYIGNRTLYFEIAKADGIASVTMDDFHCGETASVPVPISETNGTDDVIYMYKPQDAEDSEYTSAKPSAAGEYTVKAIFAETQNYNQVVATDNFVINHDYSNKWSHDASNHWHECSCGIKVDEAAHTWNEGMVTQTATCTLEGRTLYTCTVCGREKVEITAPLDHSWGAWTISTNPTLTTTGKAERVCKINPNHTENVDLPALTDTTFWTAGDYTAPTETTDGSQVYTSIYGDVTLVLPATGTDKFSIRYEDGKAIVTAPTAGTYAVIFAAYDADGRLTSLSVQTVPLVIGKNTPIKPQNFNADDKVKVMLWESLTSMKPLCAAGGN